MARRRRAQHPRVRGALPGRAVVKLEQNYRSRAPIIAVANAVIAKRTTRSTRRCSSPIARGDEKVRVVAAPRPEVEASWVARQIERLVRDDQGKRASEIAVLYRSNGQSKALEEALREQGVPHRVVGGQQFFERKEVKDVLAYMKLVAEPADEISLRRIINYPARGIGDTSVEKLALARARARWSLWQAIERVDALDDVSGGGARRVQGARERSSSETRRERELFRNRAPSGAVRALASALGCGSRDRRELAVAARIAARRWANVEGLLASFARREAREVGKDGTDGLAASCTR
jgi:superfamily I DNA/RNA helicase